MLNKEEIISRSKKVREPAIAGVYFLINQYDQIIYIGSSQDLHFRLRTHRSNINLSFNRWFYIEVDHKPEMKRLELEYIAKFTPKFNLKNNPAFDQEHELAISLMTEDERREFYNKHTNGLLSVEKMQEILNRNGIKSQIRRGNKQTYY